MPTARMGNPTGAVRRLVELRVSGEVRQFNEVAVAESAEAISQRASSLYYNISYDDIAADVAKAELSALLSAARDSSAKKEIENAMRWANKYYGHRWWKLWRNPDKAKRRLLISISSVRWVRG